jgi:hypothetical protein
LKAIVSQRSRMPAPFVMRWRKRTVEKADSIRVARPDVHPVLRREVEEGEQRVLIPAE